MKAIDRVVQRAQALYRRVRASSKLLDRLISTIEHYVEVNASAQAAASAYYAFLAFFPILAMGFFAVGYIARYFPGAEAHLIDAINTYFPGMVGTGDNQIPISFFRDNAGKIGLIGLVGLLYTGLGWLSGMRGALYVVFVRPREDRPNFFVGKFHDLYNLVLLGMALLVSVSVTSAVTNYGTQLVRLLGLEPDDYWPAHLLQGGAILLAVVVTTGVFVLMYRFLSHPSVSRWALWQGGFVAAVLFEALKVAAVTLIAHIGSRPAVPQTFALALVVVIWINFFSRIALFGASWGRVASPEPVDEEDLVGDDEGWD